MSTFDIDPEINAKAKKSLLKWGIFSICMIFAGLTSAYIVMMGSSFWVKIKMPVAFNISTAVILLSSVALLLVKRFVKTNSFGMITLLLGFALISGALFGYYQYQGWKDLFSRGSAVSAHIINQSGRYGQYFTMSYQGKEIYFDNGDFTWNGEPLSPELQAKMIDFSKALMAGADSKNQSEEFNLPNYGTEFVLTHENQLVTYANNKLAVNGQEFSDVHHNRLYRFAESIVNNRGDFIMTGKYGEDFTIGYKGEVLEYKNRTFLYKGKKLSAKQVNELQGAKNLSGSFIYVFTFVHLLHWVGGIITLLVLFIRSFKHAYTSTDSLGIQLGSTYWHFLGILWIYLYMFLIFIH